MNRMQRLMVLLVALCTMLPLLASGADAQRRDARDFIGVYERTKPVRRGRVHYLLSVSRGGRAEETVARPNGNTVVLSGRWDVRGPYMNIAMDENYGDAGGRRTFRLDGRNLILVRDPHIFYKKQ